VDVPPVNLITIRRNEVPVTSSRTRFWIDDRLQGHLCQMGFYSWRMESCRSEARSRSGLQCAISTATSRWLMF